MRLGLGDQVVDEKITILTDAERIEGQLFHLGGTKLSDFLNSSIQQDDKFLKIKSPTVYCRQSGDEKVKMPFLMVAIDQIVMIMSQAPA
jgi:hypothetical protein